MSDVIDFLERIGQEAQWSKASPEDIQRALEDVELDQAVLSAIASGEQKALEALLGLSPICGMLEPGKEDENDDEDPDEPPPADDEEKSERLLSFQQVSVS